MKKLMLIGATLSVFGSTYSIEILPFSQRGQEFNKNYLPSVFGGEVESKLSLGVGLVGSTRIYKKEDDASARIFPIIDIMYGDLYIKNLDIGYNILKEDWYTFSIFVNPLSAAMFSIEGSDMSHGYRNIDDRKYQTMLGGKIDVKTGIAGIKSSASLQGGKEGAMGSISLYKPYSVNEKIRILSSVSYNLYSEDFTDYYFGITNNEVRKSNFDKLTKSYSPDSSSSISLRLASEYIYNSNISLSAFLGIEKYSDEISESPIVENEILFVSGVGAKYNF